MRSLLATKVAAMSLICVTAVWLPGCGSSGGNDDGGSDGGGDSGACDYPKVQNVSQPCCVAFGPDACGAGLFCAALDGRTIATCYPLHSRLNGQTCTANEQCLNNTCHAGSCCGIPVGYDCVSPGDCCVGTCVQGKCTCLQPGANCVNTSDCCLGSCTGGKCTCGAAGAGCSAPTDCCGGSCDGGKCCSVLGGSCTSATDCCGGDFCAGQCCRPGGGACSSVSDCCYNKCPAGFCCDPVGDPCDASYAHCCAGSVCAQPDGFYSKYCCVLSGGPCTLGGGSGGCCHGACGNNSKCP